MTFRGVQALLKSTGRLVRMERKKRERCTFESNSADYDGDDGDDDDDDDDDDGDDGDSDDDDDYDDEGVSGRMKTM